MSHHHPRSFHGPAIALVAALVALSGCHQAADPLGVDECFIPPVAQLAPPGPILNISDTLTMHATFRTGIDPACLPPDTTSAGLRWSAENPGMLAIDSVTGHLTALRPGSGIIYLSAVGWHTDAVLGLADVGVLEPRGADSVVTTIQNRFDDSARVVLQDANGGVQRSQTVAAGQSTCWVTPLSDSLQYSAVVFVPQHADSATAPWTTHSTLIYGHTIGIVIYSYAPSVPEWGPVIVNPDPGKGC